jgi:Domain of unknown function (DUF4180)
MKIVIHEIENKKIAEIISDETVIKETQDALDLMADSDYNGAREIIIQEKHLSPLFFDLKTQLAGNILQKFSTYNVKLAIIGDFSKFESNSLQDFIRESNRGNKIYFVNTLNDALSKLSKQ